MNIYKSALFPYISGDSLVGRPVTLTMDKVKVESVPTQAGKTEERLVLYFRETQKGLILNKTNAKVIGRLYGGETDAWAGQPIELYAEKVRAFGTEHNAVRVREAPAVKGAKVRGRAAVELMRGPADNGIEAEPAPSDIIAETEAVLALAREAANIEVVEVEDLAGAESVLDAEHEAGQLVLLSEEQ